MPQTGQRPALRGGELEARAVLRTNPTCRAHPSLSRRPVHLRSHLEKQGVLVGPPNDGQQVCAPSSGSPAPPVTSVLPMEPPRSRTHGVHFGVRSLPRDNPTSQTPRVHPASVQPGRQHAGRPSRCGKAASRLPRIISSRGNLMGGSKTGLHLAVFFPVGS